MRGKVSLYDRKNVLEENGHRWWNIKEPNDRCTRCSIKYGYYLHIKKALEEYPERDDLRELKGK